jgi:hypothetical protein
MAPWNKYVPVSFARSITVVDRAGYVMVIIEGTTSTFGFVIEKDMLVPMLGEKVRATRMRDVKNVLYCVPKFEKTSATVGDGFS